jgi:hypothetical protein
MRAPLSSSPHNRLPINSTGLQLALVNGEYIYL